MQALAAATIVAAPGGVATVIGALIIPAAAVALIIFGFIRLSRAAKPVSAPQPGWQPQFPPPPPHKPAKATGITMVVVGALVLVASLTGTFIYTGGQDGAPAKSDVLAVGQCTTDTAVTSGSLEPQPLDCDDPDAVMELVSISDTNTCPDGEPPSRSLYASVSDDQTAYCFIPNLKQGNCYLINTAGRQSLKVDDCANGSPRVVKRVDDSVDPSVCSADATPVVFPEPGRVYCIEGL